MQNSASAIAAALSTAPGWARVGLTAPDPRTRAAVLDELSRHVAAGLEPRLAADAGQLGLPL